MKFKFYISYFLVMFLGTLLFSCEIETAKPSKQKQLTIVSDYLNSSDTIIFRNFSKSEKIRIKIVRMTSDKIISQFQKENFNTGFDLIMMKSLTDVLSFSKKGNLHPLKKGTHFEDVDANYSSEKYDFIGFGYDPYIVLLPEHQTIGIRMYTDLTHDKFRTNLSDKELIPLFAPILSKKNRVDANSWVKKFYEQSKQDSVYTDSLVRNLPILTSYSTLLQAENEIQFQGKKIIFPNTKSTGTFYNLRTFCISNQAENYDESLSLIQYYLSKKKNTVFNNKLKTISIHSNNIGFRKYYLSSESMAQYFIIIERLVNRIKSQN